MRILLTAFGPFHTNSFNPTEHVARLVREEWQRADELTVEILPVEYGAARARVAELGAFDVHIALGLAADRTVPTIERFAMNRRDARVTDNSGFIATGEEVDAGAPLALETTLPFKEMITRAREAGFPLEESRSAGLYVCNTVMFTAIQNSARAGFLHLPPQEHFSLDDGAALVDLLLEIAGE